MNNLVEIKNNQVVTSSRTVAETFGKYHGHVIRDIEYLIDKMGISNFGHTHKNVVTDYFYKSSYINEQNGQEYPEYLMNRDGLSLLVMGFTGKKALEWKLEYIKAFNEMEKFIQEQKPQQLQFQPKELISYMIEMRKVLKAADVSDDVIAKGFAEFSENQGVKLPKFFIEDKITEDMNIDKILEYGKTAKNPSYEDYVLTLSFPIKRSIEIKRKR